MKFLVGLLLLLMSQLAIAEDDFWITVPLYSYHLDRGKPYNENNTGLGIEYELTNTLRFIGGTYKNSIYKQSDYLGFAYTPWTFWDHVKVGIMGGLITGYDRDVHQPYPLVVPAINFETKRFGVNTVYIPPFKTFSGVVGFQLKFKIN